MREYAGVDVVNLANNHVGDYGTTALLDTIDWSRRLGLVPVGAGGSLSAAMAPRVVERLGLKIAFVGFSNILPPEFWATPTHPGNTFASAENVRASVSAARESRRRRRGDLPLGHRARPDREPQESALAATALQSGADAVIGGHPHVLQPIRTSAGGRKVVAYSLGNFVFASHRAETVRTGILHLDLSARGVERTRFQRATIDGVRPVLTGSWVDVR